MVARLKQHQTDGLLWLERRPRGGALFMEPGLGKTRTAIEYAMGKAAKMLVMAPKRAATLVWPEQVETWAPRLRCVSLTGDVSNTQRLELLFDPSVDVCIVNYELSMWLYDAIRQRKKMPYDVLCLDESTKVKTPASVSFRAMKALAHTFDAVVPMTGTPAANSLTDLWGQLWFVGGDKVLGDKVGVFRERYCREVVFENYRRWVVRDPEQLMKDVAGLCFVRRIRDCLDMPPLVHVPLTVRLGSDARRRYSRVMDEKMMPELEGMDDAALASTGAAFNKARQVVGGFAYDDEGVPHRNDRSEKLDALEDLVDERQGEPLLVIYAYREEAKMIRERTKAVLFDSASATPQLLKDWRDGKIPVMAAEATSVALALNMQCDDAALCFYSLPWSYETYYQCMARVWRQGQNTSVAVYSLLAEGTIDHHIGRVLKRKMDEDDRLKQAVLSAEEMA